MTEKIVHHQGPVTLIGGGEITQADLKEALLRAPVLVAADGGADRALALGAEPSAVIGDFDSLSAAARAVLDPSILHLVAEQETTDFDKALRAIAAPLVLAVGFLGKRLDHQLAAFNVLVQPHGGRCILIGAHELVVHLTRPLYLPLEPGAVVSLFPLTEVSGRSEGLEWPIDGLHLSPMGRVGTSNRATGPVRIDVDGPGLLAMLPRSALDDLIPAMQADPSR